MKIVFISLAALVMFGCQKAPNEEKSAGAAENMFPVVTFPQVAIDTTTPDRALMSYFAVERTSRKVRFELDKAKDMAIEKAKIKAGYDDTKFASAKMIEAVRAMKDANAVEKFEDYESEIVSVKMDTETYATIITRQKLSSETTHTSAWVLEKGVDGWRIARVSSR